MSRIVGYAYDADTHCLDCAKARFGDALDGEPTDSEGNLVTPIFSADEHAPIGDSCGTCFRYFQLPYCQECGAIWEDDALFIERTPTDETNVYCANCLPYGIDVRRMMNSDELDIQRKRLGVA